MSDCTLEFLFNLIRSNRQAREENARTLEQASPAARPWWRTQIAAFDRDYREQLDGIDELPELLVLAPRLQEDWPYPSEEALQVFRAELAHASRKPIQEIDQLRLREVIALLGGRPVQRNGPQLARPFRERTITASDIAALPRWARVAFAARCARRVQRVLAEVAPLALSEELEEIERAIAFAEQSAAEGHAADRPDAMVSAVLERAHRATVSGKGPAAPVGGIKLADLLRGSTGRAAATAAHAAAEDNPQLAHDAYVMASQAAYALSSSALLEGMRRDFLHLKFLASQQQWTDQTPVAEGVIPQPLLKLVGLHLRELRAIHRFDLPEDGLGWQGQVPDLILLGGINGSGKTTLLHFLVDSLDLLTRSGKGYHKAGLPWSLAAQEAWAEFELESYEIPRSRLRFVLGDEEFVEAHKTENCWWITRLPGGENVQGQQGHALDTLVLNATVEQRFRQVTIPSVVFLPSEDRTLLVPGEDYKAAGKLVDEQRFVHRWQPPAEWKQSLEAFFYSLRWEDLNAKEEGRYTEASHFAAYDAAFRRFVGESKYLKFVEGRLVVKISGSTVAHDLGNLSSGEKQVLLLSGELLRYWRPGSLILIDEPELHLHTRWQTRLYEALRYWQKERGGQVILATQSSHLAELAGPGSAALLGMESL